MLLGRLDISSQDECDCKCVSLFLRFFLDDKAKFKWPVRSHSDFLENHVPFLFPLQPGFWFWAVSKLTINVLASVMSFLFGWSQWQRAMTVRKILQEIVEKHPRFHNITPLKTKHVVHWCRCHGYTPPDPEALRNDEDSIEDVLTQIDSEPGECGGTGSSFLPKTLFIECLCSSTSGEGDSYFLCFNLIHSGMTKLGDCKGRPTSGTVPCPYQSWCFSGASLGFCCALGLLEAQCR